MDSQTDDSKRKQKVLVIEDERAIGSPMGILLDEQGLHIDYVPSMSDAVIYLKTEEPSLVILDDNLPDGFGVDFIPLIKMMLPDIRIIMMSGPGEIVKTAAMDNGADAFLEKPFKKDDLFKAISQLV